MTMTDHPSIGRRHRRLAAGTLTGMVLLATAGGASGSSNCFDVRGRYDEQVETEGCQSPVGLCISGRFQGSIRGSFATTVTSITPTGDTPETDVLAFTADTEVEARIRGRAGRLVVKNAGAFESTGDGNIVDLQVVTGGTDALAGAGGVLRASGLFDPSTGAGSSTYEGRICLPDS